MTDVAVHRAVDAHDGSLPARTWTDRLRPLQERAPLPVDPKVADFLHAVHESTYTLVSARTGAGKSTRLVEALWASGYLPLVSQPRVIAAIGLANRVAAELETPVGTEVGYRTANYKSYGPDTTLQYMTAGYMMQWLANGGLEQIEERATRLGRRPILVLDEVHEGDADTEFLLAWINLLNDRGAEIKVVVMSATLNQKILESYLDCPATIEVEGRTFPIERREATGTDVEEIEAQVEAGRGVLYFLPGKREIGECVTELDLQQVNAVVLPLHGELSLADQEQMFADYDVPIVVPTTNVAESSVTVPNISVVLMSGISRQMVVDERGMRDLILVPTSLASLEQQAGRAGRVEAGIAIGPLRYNNRTRPEFTPTQIESAPPWEQALRLLARGLALEELDFIHGTGSEIKKRTYPLLTRLGLLDAEGEITEKGREVASYPTTIRGGCMLYQAQKAGVLETALDAVAAFEGGGVVQHDEDSWLELCPHENDSELLAQAEIVRKMASALGSATTAEPQANSPYDPKLVDELCERYSLKAKNIVRALESRALLRERFGLSEQATATSPAPKHELLKAIAAGLFDFRYTQNERGEYTAFVGADSRWIGKLSVLEGQGVESVVGHPINITIDDGNGGKIRRILSFASRLNPRWLPEIAPHLVTERDGPATYSPKDDVVMAARQVVCDGHPVSTTSFSPIEDRARAATVFAEWFSGLMLGEKPHRSLQHNRELQQLIAQNRALLRRRTVPDTEVRAFFAEQLRDVTCLAELPKGGTLLFKRKAA